MASKYYLQDLQGIPSAQRRQNDYIAMAFEMAEADILKRVALKDYSGSGPDNNASFNLPERADSLLGALVLDASGANVLLWKKAGDFTLGANKIAVTNAAGQFNAAGDTFVFFYKPEITSPTTQS